MHHMLGRGVLLCQYLYCLSAIIHRPPVKLLRPHNVNLYEPLASAYLSGGKMLTLFAVPGSKGDKPDSPARGFTTIRFSNEQDGHRGQLDQYCSMERGFFFCTVLTM